MNNKEDTDGHSAMELRSVDTDTSIRPLSSSTPVTDQPLITTAQAIAAIVGAEGNIELAAERLFGPTSPRRQLAEIAPREKLIAILSKDPAAFNELQRQLRTLTLLSTFEMQRETSVVVRGFLAEGVFEPADVVKLFNSLQGTLGTLTDDKVSTTHNVNANIDVKEQMLQDMPPHIREAMKVALLPTTPSTSGDSPIPGRNRRRGRWDTSTIDAINDDALATELAGSGESTIQRPDNEDTIIVDEDTGHGSDMESDNTWDSLNRSTKDVDYGQPNTVYSNSKSFRNPNFDGGDGWPG